MKFQTTKSVLLLQFAFLIVCGRNTNNYRRSKFLVKRSSTGLYDAEDSKPLAVFVHETYYVNGELGFDELTNEDVLNGNGFYHRRLGNLFRARDSVVGSNSLPQRRNVVQITSPTKDTNNNVGTVNKNVGSAGKTNSVVGNKNLPPTSNFLTTTTVSPTPTTTAIVVGNSLSQPLSKTNSIVINKNLLPNNNLPTTTTVSPTTTTTALSNSINVQKDNKIQNNGGPLINGLNKNQPQTFTIDDYNPIFDFRALKRKEGEEFVLHKETVQKFKSHPPPSTGPNANLFNALPERPASSVWTG